MGQPRTPQLRESGGMSAEAPNCRRERQDPSPTPPFSPWQCALPWVTNPVLRPVEPDPEIPVEAGWRSLPASPSPSISPEVHTNRHLGCGVPTAPNHPVATSLVGFCHPIPGRLSKLRDLRHHQI